LFEHPIQLLLAVKTLRKAHEGACHSFVIAVNTDILVLKLTLGKSPTLKCVDAQEKLGVSITMDITHVQLAAL